MATRRTRGARSSRCDPHRWQLSWLGYLGHDGRRFHRLRDHRPLRDARRHAAVLHRALAVRFRSATARATRAGKLRRAAPSREACRSPPRTAWCFVVSTRSTRLLRRCSTSGCGCWRRSPGACCGSPRAAASACANLRIEAERRGMRRRAAGVRAARPAGRASRAPRARRPRFSTRCPTTPARLANDALFTGCPVLTCMGATMAGRVAAKPAPCDRTARTRDDGPAGLRRYGAADRPRAGSRERAARKDPGQSLPHIRCSTWRFSRATWKPRSGPSSAPDAHGPLRAACHSRAQDP